MKLNDKNGLSKFESESEEIYSRRLKMKKHSKVVLEFSESNVPILIESLC
jgi:hypothetical protein